MSLPAHDQLQLPCSLPAIRVPSLKAEPAAASPAQVVAHFSSSSASKRLRAYQATAHWLAASATPQLAECCRLGALKSLLISHSYIVCRAEQTEQYTQALCILCGCLEHDHRGLALMVKEWRVTFQTAASNEHRSVLLRALHSVLRQNAFIKPAVSLHGLFDELLGLAVPGSPLQTPILQLCATASTHCARAATALASPAFVSCLLSCDVDRHADAAVAASRVLANIALLMDSGTSWVLTDSLQWLVRCLDSKHRLVVLYAAGALRNCAAGALSVQAALLESQLCSRILAQLESACSEQVAALLVGLLCNLAAGDLSQCAQLAASPCAAALCHAALHVVPGVAQTAVRALRRLSQHAEAVPHLLAAGVAEVACVSLQRCTPASASAAGESTAAELCCLLLAGSCASADLLTEAGICTVVKTLLDSTDDFRFMQGAAVAAAMARDPAMLAQLLPAQRFTRLTLLAAAATEQTWLALGSRCVAACAAGSTAGEAAVLESCIWGDWLGQLPAANAEQVSGLSLAIAALAESNTVVSQRISASGLIGSLLHAARHGPALEAWRALGALARDQPAFNARIATSGTLADIVGCLQYDQVRQVLACADLLQDMLSGDSGGWPDGLVCAALACVPRMCIHLHPRVTDAAACLVAAIARGNELHHAALLKVMPVHLLAALCSSTRGHEASAYLKAVQRLSYMGSPEVRLQMSECHVQASLVDIKAAQSPDEALAQLALDALDEAR